MTAPFWLPSLFRMDAAVHGALGDPVLAPNLNAGPLLRKLGIDERFLADYLDEVSPALEALFMAGYKVPWLEFGLQHLASAGGVSPAPNQIWIRVDLQNRRIEVNSRSDTTSTNVVRLNILPIRSAERDFALPLTGNVLVTTLSNIDPQTTEAEERLDLPMLDHLVETLSRGTQLTPGFLEEHDPPSPSMTLNVHRSNVAVLVAGAAANMGGVAEVPLWIRVSDSAFASAKDATNAIFQTMRLVIFDTISLTFGHMITDAVDSYAAAATPADIGSEAFGYMETLPGMTWVLNPRTWERQRPQTQNVRDISPFMDTLVVVADILFQLARTNQIANYTDLIDLSTAGDTQPSDFVHEKRAGFLYGLAFGDGLDIRTEPAIATQIWPKTRLARMVDVILGHSARTSRRERRRADRLKEHKQVVWDHPYAKISDSFEGLLYDALLSRRSAEAVDDDASGLDNIVHEFFKAYKAMVGDFGDIHGAIDSGLVTRLARRESYLSVVLSLFNFGIMSIEMILGDLNADLEQAGVEVFDDDSEIPTHGVMRRMRFKHTLYDLPGFLAYQLGHDGTGLALEDLIAWEYVPAQPDLPDAIRLPLVAAGLYPEDNRDRLIIVAGPGIAISGLEDWPGQVPVEIYRVQSAALVPDREERINVQMLQTGYPINILDDIDHISGSNDDPQEPLLDRRHELMSLPDGREKFLPFVSVKQLRKNGKCGVSISTRYPNDPQYLGLDGTAAIEILMDETSGSQRFAFDIRYELHDFIRVVDKELQTFEDYDPELRRHHTYQSLVAIEDRVHVAQFQVIVQATDGVDINIEDDKLGPVYDWINDVAPGTFEAIADPTDNTFLYSIWRGAFGDIPDQGAALSPNARGFTVDTSDYDAEMDEEVVEHLKTIFDIGLGFFPIVGEVTDVVELLASFYTGTDKFGRPMTNFDRLLIVGGLALPLVSGNTLKVIKGTAPSSDLLKAVAGIDP